MEATDTDIQPDSGSFDVAELLKMLKDMGYAGPVGLQCYGLRGDASGGCNTASAEGAY
jgi:sugar phosphate isomerase/epimerase